MTLPRTLSRSGGLLRSTRIISNLCTASYADDDVNFTSMLVAFGQFLDHDLDHVPDSKSKRSKVIEMYVILNWKRLTYHKQY